MTVWVESPFDNLPAEGFRRQRYWMMAEAFAAAGHEVVYFTSDFNHGTKARRVLRPEGSRTRTPEDEGADGSRVAPLWPEKPLTRPGARPFRPKLILIPTPAYRANVSLSRVWSHCAYARRLKRAAQAQQAEARPDVVIAAAPTLGSAAAMQTVARSCGALFVLDVQDAWPETFYRLLPGPLRFCGKLPLAPWHARARKLYRTADFVTGVSERYRALTGRDDYLLAYHGVGAGPFRPKHTERPKRLVYLGNLGAGYDLATVVAAVAADATLTLDIAGRGPREAELRAQVTRFALAERVRFHGYLEDAALRALLAACDVGVIPMRDDSWVGLPYKLGDYLAAGLRVVSSLHGECGDLLVREGLGATYDFGSSSSFAAALERIVTLPETQAALPDCLREDRIYPAYVAAVIARLSSRRTP